MKKVILIILSLALTFCFSESGLAAGCLGKDSGTITGQVSAIDLNTRTITVKEVDNKAETSKVYKFDSATNFVKGDELKSSNDLKLGDTVTIFYQTNGNDIYAKTITITSEK